MVLTPPLTGERGQVVSPSRHKREPPQLQINIADQLPEAAQYVPTNATFPSPRCAHREEWQGACRLWSGKTHNRYLVFNHLRAKEGIGANLMRVAWGLNRAISFDLEPVFVGPLLAGHGTGEFGDWMGLTNNPLMVIQDPEAFERATNQSVPFPEGDHDGWFREQENRTFVIYKADAMSVHKIKDWGKTVPKPNSDTRVCLYVRQALRTIYWSVPQKRGRCHAFMTEGHHAPPESVVSEATGYQPERKRPWVLAVHVRRGDMIQFHNGARSIPHRYFSAAVNSVLRGIAIIDPAAHVSVLVFSEGPTALKGLQLPDEHGNAVTWDIGHESCLDIGLNCSQVRDRTTLERLANSNYHADYGRISSSKTNYLVYCSYVLNCSHAPDECEDLSVQNRDCGGCCTDDRSSHHEVNSVVYYYCSYRSLHK